MLFVISVLEASTEYSIIATDVEGTIQLWNEGARRLYGYASAEVIGEHTSLLHIEEDALGGLPDAMMQEARERGSWEGAVKRVRKDGSPFTARVMLTPRRGTDGELIGFLLMSSDITDGLKLTAEVERLHYTLSVLESAPDAMVIVDRAGEIRLANAETETLFGYTREELIGRPVEVLIPERYHDRHPDHRSEFFSKPRVATDGRRARAVGQAQGRSRVPGRDQPQPARDRRRPARDGRDPRRDRAQAVRAGAPGGKRQAGGGEPRQGSLPGEHEPRAAHAAERDPGVHRHAPDGAAGTVERGAGQAAAHGASQRTASPVADQRPARSGPDPVRQARPERRTDRVSGPAGGGPPRAPTARGCEGSRVDAACPRRTNRGSKRPAGAEPDPDQPRQQRDQVHRRGQRPPRGQLGTPTAGPWRPGSP